MSSVAPGVLREREHELAIVRDGLRRAQAGEGALMLVEGQPGLGKTELVREARANAGRAQLTVLEAKGSELEQPFAFGIVRQLLEPVIAKAPDAEYLFAGAAGPAERLFDADERQPSRPDADFDALDGLYWLIVNLSDRAPVLVSVDDCHWSDLDSLRLLAYLGQRIEGLPVAVLLAGRPPDGTADQTAALWTQIASRPDAVALYPRTLSEPAAAALVRQRLGDHADEEFCRACHTATGGNPLFLRELVGALEAAGVEPTAAAAGQVQTVGPAAVARFVLHRVAVLGPVARELASAVAVLGDDSDLQLVARVASLSEPVARRAADDLARADIFTRTTSLSFVHPIVRAALYEDLAPGQRQARHAAAADVLTQLGESPERVTTHLLLTDPSGDQRRVRTLRAAAAAAARRGAPRAAATRLNRALAEGPAEPERAEMLAELGIYEIAALRFAAAEEHLRAAIAASTDLAARADAASILARCAIVSGGLSADDAFDTVSSLARELAPLDRERSLELGSDLLTLGASVPALRPRLEPQLREFALQARSHAGYEAVAKIYLALEQLVAGGSAQAAADQVQTALKVGLPAPEFNKAGLVAVHALRISERYELALRLLDLGLQGARREGHAARQGLIHGQRAVIALAQGLLQDAQVEAETGLRVVDHNHFAFLQLVAVAMVVRIERGELEAAGELARGVDAIGLAEDRLYTDLFLIARAKLRLAQREEGSGLADLLWCGERLEANGVRWSSEWPARAVLALVAEGERERAQVLASEHLARARSVGAPGALGLMLRATARAHDDAEALTLLEEATAVLETGSARLELAYALADLGATLNRAGRRREGRDAERRAIELAEACGAIVLAQDARAEFDAGPGRRARVALTGPNSLTAAERRVCQQAADGNTNREIAQALFVTEKTVERHLSSAYQKLGIRSRFQLAAAIAAD